MSLFVPFLGKSPTVHKHNYNMAYPKKIDVHHHFIPPAYAAECNATNPLSVLTLPSTCIRRAADLALVDYQLSKSPISSFLRGVPNSA